MLKWAIIFFIISLIAGYLGYGKVAIATADIAKIFFYIFAFLFFLALVLLLLGK